MYGTQYFSGRKIHDLMEQGHKIILIILEDNTQSKAQACLKEKEYISSYKSSDFDLRNATIGGIGPSGYVGFKET